MDDYSIFFNKLSFAVVFVLLNPSPSPWTHPSSGLGLPGLSALYAKESPITSRYLTADLPLMGSGMGSGTPNSAGSQHPSTVMVGVTRFPTAR